MLYGAWSLVRLPLLLLLVTLEPVVALLCGALALLGVLATFFFAALHLAHFPTVTMFLLSLGFGGVLFLYHALIRLLGR